MEQFTVHMESEGAVATPFWGSLLHGMLMARLPQPWPETLHNDDIRPYSQWVEPVEGTRFRWHIQVLSDDAAAVIGRVLAAPQAWRCDHLRENIKLCEIERAVCSPQAFIKPFFLNEEPMERLRIHFHTTTTHKTQGSYALYPTVALMAQSLRKRYALIDPTAVFSDEEVLSQIIEHTDIERYHLRSGSFSLEGARVHGYTGTVELCFHGPESLIRLSSLLFSFAQWCGMGAKTALGMGGCSVSQPERRIQK